MRRPKRTPATSEVKLSSCSTRLAASRATSVPRSPMATPMSAARKAGASFTPSPVIATTWPCACRARTMRSFCSGAMRAKIDTDFSWACSCASSNAPICAPASTSVACNPAARAIARAVSGASPVIMTTRMPAAWHSRMACGTSSRSGSRKPNKPNQCKRGSSAASAAAPFHSPSATANTRKPCCDIAAAKASASAGSSSHRSCTASGAPLTTTRPRPKASRHQWLTYKRWGAMPMRRRRPSRGQGPTPLCSCTRPIARSMGSMPSSLAACAAALSRGNKVDGTGLPSPTVACVCASARPTKAMRLTVSVPVLSTASTLVVPKASMACGWRVSTCCWASRHAPKAIITVHTTANSSGISDIASVRPASRPWVQSPRCATYKPPANRLTATAIAATQRTVRSSSACTRLARGASCDSEAPMRPSAVCAPVRVTRAQP